MIILKPFSRHSLEAVANQSLFMAQISPGAIYLWLFLPLDANMNGDS